VLAPEINAATIRLRRRLGCEVVVARRAGCCGALNHHMRQHASAMARARANIEAWSREIDEGGLDAVVINTSGCGTTVKDYGFMFRNEPSPWRERAATVSALAKDISEYLAGIDYAPVRPAPGLRVTYHAACSLQHGQRITEAPKSASHGEARGAGPALARARTVTPSRKANDARSSSAARAAGGR